MAAPSRSIRGGRPTRSWSRIRRTTDNETEVGNNTAIAKNTVGGSGIDLVLSKIVDNPDPVQNGQNLTYTVVVVNGGTEDTTTTGKDVVVRLDAPQTGLTFLSAAGSNGFNGDAPNANKQIICKGALPGGGTRLSPPVHGDNRSAVRSRHDRHGRSG